MFKCAKVSWVSINKSKRLPDIALIQDFSALLSASIKNLKIAAKTLQNHDKLIKWGASWEAGSQNKWSKRRRMGSTQMQLKECILFESFHWLHREVDVGQIVKLITFFFFLTSSTTELNSDGFILSLLPQQYKWLHWPGNKVTASNAANPFNVFVCQNSVADPPINCV